MSFWFLVRCKWLTPKLNSCVKDESKFDRNIRNDLATFFSLTEFAACRRFRRRWSRQRRRRWKERSKDTVSIGNCNLRAIKVVPHHLRQARPAPTRPAPSQSVGLSSSLPRPQAGCAGNFGPRLGSEQVYLILEGIKKT